MCQKFWKKKKKKPQSLNAIKGGAKFMGFFKNGGPKKKPAQGFIFFSPKKRKEKMGPPRGWPFGGKKKTLSKDRTFLGFCFGWGKGNPTPRGGNPGINLKQDSPTIWGDCAFLGQRPGAHGGKNGIRPPPPAPPPLPKILKPHKIPKRTGQGPKPI